MHTVRSLVCGEWVQGQGERETLLNPATEEVLGHASIGGVDLARALDFARTRGGPALRELTFAQRGELLKAMSKVIYDSRDELLDIATRNGGNTRSDGKFDVDGASGTLAFYAGLGKKLGDIRYLVDGEDEPLGRSARFFGRHLFTPHTGAAVLLNAYNFPAWGFAEKAAAALLAGMPVVNKPAPSTALLAERVTQLVHDAAILPEGALTFLAGPPGDLVEHLQFQDVLAFTGSCRTGRWLRTLPLLAERGVRLNVEADSINAAILDPDVSGSDDTYSLFLEDVLRDMTQKAGQKCTAIRRILVPEDRLDEVADDLSARLGDLKIGDPARDDVRMGPLVSADQLRRVREGVATLEKSARRVHGSTEPKPRLGVPEGRGFFIDPILLRAEDPHAEALHTLEVFGPVSTLVPYSGKSRDAIELVRRGQGGLVASVYSDGRGFVEDVVLGLAPYHGRLYLGSSKVGEATLGPGAVPPQLVHGGPGRAGGGEELGGARGLHHYMQRTAIQGYRAILEKVFTGA